MNKEYISPEIDFIVLLVETPFLTGSVNNPEIEEFSVSDGEW